MATIAEVIERELLTWPGVTAHPHRYGGIEYHANHHEIGHVHGSRLADLPFPVRIREQLVASGRASPHHILPNTGWVSYWISSDADIEAVIDLFRLNYERITKSKHEQAVP